MPPELIIIFAFFALMMWFMSRSQKKMAAKMAEQREAALVIGKTVVTQAGMIGEIVDIDGDVVTLESPSGDETQWLKTGIQSEIEPPYASTFEEDEMDDGAAEADLDGEESFMDLDEDTDEAHDGLTPHDVDLGATLDDDDRGGEALR
ncbi:MAG: preprotein translocase subunit YajC [Flaviflexus sp.]|nr:preprotein translocase subunit YajC [Flaviflexus sp.]